MHCQLEDAIALATLRQGAGSYVRCIHAYELMHQLERCLAEGRKHVPGTSMRSQQAADATQVSVQSS